MHFDYYGNKALIRSLLKCNDNLHNKFCKPHKSDRVAYQIVLEISANNNRINKAVSDIRKGLQYV